MILLRDVNKEKKNVASIIIFIIDKKMNGLKEEGAMMMF